MKRIILLLITASLGRVFIFSQNIEIAGKVIDNESAILEGATVGLYSNDSTWVTSSISDIKGNFILKDLKKNSYTLEISYVGFVPYVIIISNLDGKTDIGTVCLIPDNLLEEITIVASSKRYDINKQILIPTKSQLEISNNGWTLMKNMQLSRIRINPLTNEISTQDGQNVIFQINGMNVEKEEVAVLRPQNIVRVEYLDQPGVRFQAGAVINYVVKHRENGGNIYVDGNQTLSSEGIKRYGLGANYNWKKSQLGIIASYNENRARWTRENKYHYQLPDYAFDRNEEGLPTMYKDKLLNLSAKYTIYETDKYQFSITLRSKYNNVPNQFSDRQGYVTDSRTDVRSFMQDFSTWKSQTPSLDLYFHRKLKSKQSLIFNIVSTIIDSKNEHSYLEYINASDTISSVYSQIDGKKYSLIAEGVYEKSFDHSKWSTGIYHSQSYTRNKYAGNIRSDVSMRYINSHLFADYTYSHDKFSLNVGMSGKYARYSQKGELSEKLYVEPHLQLKYSFSDKIFLRYSGRIYSTSPSLSDLNDTELQVDTWQIRRGNPDLRTYTTSRQDLLFSYNHKTIDVELAGRYSYSDNPIMTSLFYENGKIVNMEENQLCKHRLTVESTLTFRPFGDYVSLSATPGVNRYIVKGNLYAHNYTNWYVRASLLANYQRWFLNAQVSTRSNSIDGEVVDYSESFHDFGIGYNAKRWSLSAGVMLPFTKEYSQASRNVSDIAYSYSKVFSKDLSCLFYLSVSVNLDYGKKFKTQKQGRSNSDNDSGILSTGKVRM